MISFLYRCIYIFVKLTSSNQLNFDSANTYTPGYPPPACHSALLTPADNFPTRPASYTLSGNANSRLPSPNYWPLIIFVSPRKGTPSICHVSNFFRLRCCRGGCCDSRDNKRRDRYNSRRCKRKQSRLREICSFIKIFIKSTCNLQ